MPNIWLLGGILFFALIGERAGCKPALAEKKIMTIRELFEEEYQPIRLMGKKNTVRLYRLLLNRLKDFSGEDPGLEFFDDKTVSKFLSWRLANVSAHSAERERAQICALWRYAVNARIAFDCRLPEIKPLTLPDKVPTAWTIQEIKMIIETASNLSDRYAGSTCGIPLKVFFPLLIEVLWITAERVGAIMQTERTDLRGEYLFVQAKNRKGRAKHKTTRLPTDLVDRLQELPATRMLFPWDRSHHQLWAWMKRIIQRSGAPGGFRCSFHQIRRSSASHFVAGGGSATDLLGHSDPRIAEEHYIDPRIAYAEKQPAYELLPSIQ